MACIRVLREEFLSCCICTEIYTDPCTLGCQHSFCRKCVTEYTKTRPNAVQSKTIPCAMCRQVTPVPNPTRPVTEWAKQLRPSLMLQGLMDKFQSQHKHMEGIKVCFLCKEIGETTQASSWCSDCEVALCSRCTRMHLKAPSSRHHDLYDQDAGVTISKDKCREHKREQIRFICKDCNKSACQTCCISKHKGCKHIVILASVMPGIKSVPAEKKRVLRKKMNETRVVVTKEESRIEQLKKYEKRGEEEVKTTITTAIALLNKQQNRLLKQIHDASGKQIAEHQISLKSSKIANQLYQQHSEFINQALQSESEVDLPPFLNTTTLVLSIFTDNFEV